MGLDLDRLLVDRLTPFIDTLLDLDLLLFVKRGLLVTLEPTSFTQGVILHLPVAPRGVSEELLGHEHLRTGLDRGRGSPHVPPRYLPPHSLGSEGVEAPAVTPDGPHPFSGHRLRPVGAEAALSGVFGHASQVPPSGQEVKGDNYSLSSLCPPLRGGTEECGVSGGEED